MTCNIDTILGRILSVYNLYVLDHHHCQIFISSYKIDQKNLYEVLMIVFVSK